MKGEQNVLHSVIRANDVSVLTVIEEESRRPIVKIIIIRTDLPGKKGVGVICMCVCGVMWR